MGQALARWIEGSLATLEALEKERDQKVAALEQIRRTAESQRSAVQALDEEIKKLHAEREAHSRRMTELADQLTEETVAFEALQQDVAAMYEALDSVAGADSFHPATKGLVSSAAKSRVVAQSQTKMADGLKPEPQSSSAPSATKAVVRRNVLAEEPAVPKVIVNSHPDSGPLDIGTGRSPARRVASVVLVLGVLGGVGYFAYQTGPVADAVHQIRAFFVPGSQPVAG